MIKFCLFLGTFLLLGMSPQDNLIINTSNKMTISNVTLKETAVANVQKVNRPVVFIHDKETARQLDECFEIAKQYQEFNNPPAKLVNEFLLPKRLSSLTTLEIFDLATLPFLFGGVVTKSATFLGKAKFHKPIYALLKEAKISEPLTQGEKYAQLLKKHITLRKEIEVLETLEISTLKAGKKGIKHLEKIEQKTIELLRTEKSLNKLLSEWIP